MTRHWPSPKGWGAALLIWALAGGVRCVAQAASGGDAPPPAAPPQEQPEVLTRGPVHEAFAEPVTVQAQPGLVVPDAPPADVQEIPPAERPEGAQLDQ